MTLTVAVPVPQFFGEGRRHHHHHRQHGGFGGQPGFGAGFGGQPGFGDQPG